MELQQLVEKIDRLPAQVQEQLADYIEFLVLKYESVKEPLDIEQIEPSPYAREFLKDRKEKMLSSPESNSTWTDVKKRMYQKRGWKL